MEILMKVKCSSSPNSNGSTTRPTLKVVDHHHQLQQQHNPHKASRPNGLHHVHRKPNLGLGPTPEKIMSPCMDYVGLDCCTAAVGQKHMIDLQWSHQGQARPAPCSMIPTATPTECATYCEYGPCCSGMDLPACCAGYNTVPPVQHSLGGALSLTTLATNETHMPYEYQEPEENFVSIEDEKVKAFLMKIGEEQKLQQAQRHKSPPPPPTPLIREQVIPAAPAPVVFEIIELGDVQQQERLQHLKEKAERRAKEQKIVENRGNEQGVIEPLAPSLLQKSLPNDKRKSPSISLIPKSPENKKELCAKPVEAADSKPIEKIIARIDLIDSSESECEADDGNVGTEASNINDERTNADDSVDFDDDDDGDSSKLMEPLLAAAAVSCELGCDDEDDDDNLNEDQDVRPQTLNENSSNLAENIVILNSDDDENMDFIDEHEEGPELRWDDFEDHSSSRERQLHECYVCGKKVQSNYNLRRHMMIHTGERPFGCDLCDRRFREISDLKKHRRRHANEKNFVCMICRINPPLETDSTRCSSCDTRNGALISAVRPDPAKTPPYVQENSNPDFKKSLEPQSKTQTTSVTLALPPLTPIIPKPYVDKWPATEAQSSTLNAHSSYNSESRLNTRKEFPCPLCKRTFGTRHNLKRHFMIHTGEKPFNCPRCRKPFREYSTLKKHLVTHRRDRWYKCLRCPQKYRDYLDYMEHKNTHSSDASSDDGGGGGGDNITPKKRAKFNDYDDAYNSNEDEDDDDASIIEDCLECCECGQRFTEIEQFTEHIKEHDSNRILYECYICKQLFEEHKDLVTHMSEDHKDEA